MNEQESKILRRVVAHANTGIFKPFRLLDMSLELKTYDGENEWCLYRVDWMYIPSNRWSKPFTGITREGVYQAACELAVREILES